jgi:hypothetical protein
LTAPNGATQTSVITVTGNGTFSSASFKATQVGTYAWTAVYSGNSNNNGAHDQGGVAGPGARDDQTLDTLYLRTANGGLESLKIG